MPPSPWIGSIRIAAVAGVIAASSAFMVAEGHLVEAVDLWPEAFQVFLAAGGDGRERAAVEGALEGDDAEALGRAIHIVIAARRLDRAFHRLGAGIGEEYAVGEARRDELLRRAALAGNLEDVGDVPELLGLRLQRGDQVRMRMAEHVDRDAAHEVEIAPAVGGEEPRALASLEGEVGPGVGGIERRIRADFGLHSGGHVREKSKAARRRLPSLTAISGWPESRNRMVVLKLIESAGLELDRPGPCRRGEHRWVNDLASLIMQRTS